MSAEPGRRVERRACRIVGAGPAVDRDRLLTRRVGQGEGVGHEVHEVVRVEVRDEDRVDVHVVMAAAQLAENSVAAIEHDRRAVLGHEIAAAGATGVLPRGRFSQHGELHRLQTMTGANCATWHSSHGRPVSALRRIGSDGSWSAALDGPARRPEEQHRLLRRHQTLGPAGPEGHAGLVEIERAEHLFPEVTVLALRSLFFAGGHSGIQAIPATGHRP